MTVAQAYGWGCLGGFVAAFVVYVLPDFAQAAIDDAFVLSRRRLLRKAFVVLSMTAVAGVFCLIPASAPARPEALAIGLGAQGSLKGLFAAGREAFPGAR
ncbi:MAG TPA: hypothetical protein VMU75_01630 [Acidimicrobiales bacterium]|nr:hypothetical protein [Acidimicrobiales bacterium]